MAKFSVETKNKDSDVKTEGKDWKFSTIYIIAQGGRGGGGVGGVRKQVHWERKWVKKRTSLKSKIFLRIFGTLKSQ